MTILLDAISTQHLGTLLAAGCSFIHINNVGLRTASDVEIIRYCGQHNYILASEDDLRGDKYKVQAMIEANIGYIHVRFRKQNIEHKDKIYLKYLHSLWELSRHPVPFYVRMNSDGLFFKPFSYRVVE
ncbi:MAG: DUF5615 family PIN-like protein [Actinobacteria bacterium]|nr:DUF5615 family PIN-like protein [Actinomycetota bacterium]